MYRKSDPETIQKMFGSIAASYDRTNAALSFGLHKRWNKALVRTLLNAHTPETVLDLCGGTGEIAFTFLRQSREKPPKIQLLDFCPEMLECAKAKEQLLPLALQHHLSYLQADAQEIPLSTESIDCASIAYGIRNVSDPRKCLSEVFRVLKPGGSFGILELTRPSSSILNAGHRLYLRSILPIAGWCFSANRSAYQYLCSSIQMFINPDLLQEIMDEIGFCKVEVISLSGGIATILFAKKPL